ncbi:uncharacterized protein LOC107407938 isoform X1 [Ziziphus jujuba]|uniref:Uncharacterized protein LOC107407938 isoform X1 n=1 Tax=Ziziphus jujuba TaxID=326968 RepID=A0A6P3Z1V0_ZIZJJ|nr:uncharacterized protein LOC107407938 isoform X1 [Ziziphus jujuba]
MEGYKCNCTKLYWPPKKLPPSLSLAVKQERKGEAKMEKGIKGTVTSVSSMYPAEEAQKAAKRVQDAIAEKQEELERLRDFISDNTNLVTLVQRLPDQLQHDIMVPFGKAAFFPGRLKHTNEFLVLLGDGYYAERTSIQTMEILKRRGKTLQSQVDSLNAMVEDLKAEASFFDATAAEAAEGFLEIREDYVDESSARESESDLLKQISSSSPEADNKTNALEDEEFARIMSRMDELEKEELAAESYNETGEHEETDVSLDSFSDQISLHQVKNSEEPEFRKPPDQAKYKNTMSEEVKSRHHHHQDFTNRSQGNIFPGNVSTSSQKTLMPPEMDKVQAAASSRHEPPLQTSTSKPEFDSQKAFTGSIVEHPYNLERNSSEQTVSKSGSQRSKPVSRFKMQRK